LRLLPNIRYGTERYIENIARRVRLLNISAWIGSGVAVFFASKQILDPTPGLQKVAAINALSTLVLMAVPLLHRIGHWRRRLRLSSAPMQPSSSSAFCSVPAQACSSSIWSLRRS
jgi:hypothetical protein